VNVRSSQTYFANRATVFKQRGATLVAVPHANAAVLALRDELGASKGRREGMDGEWTLLTSSKVKMEIFSLKFAPSTHSLHIQMSVKKGQIWGREILQMVLYHILPYYIHHQEVVQYKFSNCEPSVTTDYK
jgi:hypothetical protein